MNFSHFKSKTDMNHIRYNYYGGIFVISTKDENILIGILDQDGNLHAMNNRQTTKEEWDEIQQVWKENLEHEFDDLEDFFELDY